MNPPALSLKVYVPACAGAGEELDYRIIIENRSSTAAHHVMIHDPLPANARYVKAKPEPRHHATRIAMEVRHHRGLRATRDLPHARADRGRRNQELHQHHSEHGVCVCTQVGDALVPEHLPVSPRPVDEGPGKPGVGGLSLVKTGPKRTYVSAAIPYQLTVTNQGAAGDECAHRGHADDEDGVCRARVRMGDWSARKCNGPWEHFAAQSRTVEVHCAARPSANRSTPPVPRPKGVSAPRPKRAPACSARRVC